MLSANFWKRQARTWHWMSGAVCLLGILAFSVTGITLNHGQQIVATPVTRANSTSLPQQHLEKLGRAAEMGGEPLPEIVIKWLQEWSGEDLRSAAIEWSPYEIIASLPRPGGDAWLSVDLASGHVVHESTSRGVVAYLNDLHKGRNTGVAWGWFIDVFAAACIVFCLTGLWLLQIHAARRRATWPLVGLGLMIPAILALAFIH